MKSKVNVVSVLLVLAVLIPSAMCGFPVFAADSPATNWNDYAAAGFAGGDGTEASPYLISSAEELAYLSVYSQSNVTRDKYFRVTVHEIDLDAHQWTPIGNSAIHFTGIFDGNGAVVRNLRLENGTYDAAGCGMFARANDATIQNLTLEVILADPTGTNMVGTIVGSMYNASELIDCTVSVRATASQTSVPYWGGAVGYLTGNSVIDGVNVYGTMDIVTAAGKETHLGGVVGRTNTSNAGTKTVEIRNAVNYADIRYVRTGGGTAPLGGIVGATQHDDIAGTTTKISNCINYGSLTVEQATNGRVGGIVGNGGRASKGTIGTLICQNCVNAGTLTGNPTASIIAYEESKETRLVNCFSTTADPLYNKGTASGAAVEGCMVGISLETLTGARVRIDTTDDGASGIRFDSLIDKSIYDGLTEMNGVSVELGTVIAPSANIAAVADCHDKIAALEAGGSSTYVAVPYKNAVWINDQYANDDGYLETAYYFSGAVAKIHSNNFLLDYTAVAYLKITVDGWSFTVYADDGVEEGSVRTDRVRSVGYVGYQAYQDGLQNAGTYSDAQMAVLKVYSDAYTASQPEA